MELRTALKRVGAIIVKEKIAETEATLYLRVDPAQGEVWVAAITEFLLGVDGKTYKVDLSKYFYVSEGAIRYLWRVVLTGAVEAALGRFGAAAMQAVMARTPEMTSFPLVGRIQYPCDPARGLLKGGHDLETTPGLLSAALGSGIPGGAA